MSSDSRLSGLPESDPLAELTSLFERARYGQEKLDQEDERAASAALRLIIKEIEQA